MAELQRIMDRMGVLAASAQAAHAKAVHARQKAPQSMTTHQSEQHITTAVVDRLSRLPNEVANAMEQTPKRKG